jgi:signal transduction histidine kinase
VVAKTLVLTHLDHIWVESQPGEGSRFSFSIPRSDLGPTKQAADAN